MEEGVSIKGMHIVVSIPKEYLREAADTDDAVLLDMPADYASGLCDFICRGIEEMKQEIEGKQQLWIPRASA